MTGKSFGNLSMAECRTASDAILSEANKHWENAQAAATHQQDYGYAISMMIISSEELVKGTILFLDSLGFKLRNLKGMKALFKSHTMRYLVVYIMYAMGLLMDELKGFILLLQSNPTLIMEWMVMYKKDDPDFTRLLKYYGIKKVNQFKREFHWFSKVDKLRQNGFYSDYDEFLIVPSDLTLEDYNHARERFSKAKDICIGLIASIREGNPEFKNFIEQTMNDMKTKGRYTSIENWLEQLKSYKNDPFALTLAYLSNPHTFQQTTVPPSKQTPD
ncbi:AbiV family abortive infection protein [Niastella caeni]|uniref:AbiV family abortive infection protein n=1 Tax=Niastella caeni TaxID=2569763 RepID=A0A4S8HFV7_9BACT|nr:AbiV family abortive infection protein [Niastella caeni]THU33009.1 AbiV family abortive infection protein [Niastella caeni]